MRPTYERLSALSDVLHRVAELSARTVIFDVEPLVTLWGSGQQALDRGVELVLSEVLPLAVAVAVVHAVISGPPW